MPTVASTDAHDVSRERAPNTRAPAVASTDAGFVEGATGGDVIWVVIWTRPFRELHRMLVRMLERMRQAAAADRMIAVAVVVCP